MRSPVPNSSCTGWAAGWRLWRMGASPAGKACALSSMQLCVHQAVDGQVLSQEIMVRLQLGVDLVAASREGSSAQAWEVARFLHGWARVKRDVLFEQHMIGFTGPS